MADLKGIPTPESPIDDYAIVELDRHGSIIKAKYQGTEDDKLAMRVLGRKQETRRIFNFITMLGFGSTLICTWEAIMTNIGAILTNGGTAGMFWGYLVVIIGYTLVYASLSEMASMAPTSGGQYHWVSEFAPDSCQRYLSYMTGWLTFTGWQSAVTGIGFLVATVIPGLVSLDYPDYTPERWHSTLILIAIVTVCVALNLFAVKQLPMIEGSLAILHFGGLLAMVGVLAALAPRYNNAHDAFLKLQDLGGWGSDGLSFMIGLYPLTFALLGFDAQVHMSEEIQGANRAMPRSIMWSTYVNSFLGLVMVITLIFTMGDLNEITKSRTGFPFIQVVYNATRSHAGTIILGLCVILPLVGSCIACVATASRQIWAFARDDGVPFSNFVRRVHPRYNVPVNAILISLIVAILLSLINIGSTAAVNAVISLDLTALFASYTTSIGCLTLKRLRGEPLPPREWSLGRWGLITNIASLVWLVPIFVFTLFPSVSAGGGGLNAETMNYGCLLLGFMVLFSTAYYVVHGRKVYVSPKQRVHRELQGVEGR